MKRIFEFLLFLPIIFWGWASNAQAISISINEIDPNTPGTDSAEFIELYDGGVGNTLLSGYFLVYFNGNGDISYNHFDLEGYFTDSQGFFLLGQNKVNPDLTATGSALQNGPDAVALYKTDNFPNGTAVTTENLIDAIVYGGEDSGLFAGLGVTVQYNENQFGFAEDHSLARQPDGSFLAQIPTPGAPNTIPTPEPATVLLTGLGLAAGVLRRMSLRK